jgi:RNA polymerase sigma-70 factor (ECF subfamily)
MNDTEFVAVLEQARAGDEQAVAALLTTFESDVRIIVRARLPRALRGQFDSMDFVQAVWASVFTGPDQAIPEFANLGHFRGYLAGVARNKILDEYRRRTKSRKYDLSREEPLYVRHGGRETLREVPARDPTPSAFAQASDRFRQLTRGRDRREATILELRRRGLTFEEIAAQTGLHERTVRRFLDTMRRREEDQP